VELAFFNNEPNYTNEYAIRKTKELLKLLRILCTNIVDENRSNIFLRYTYLEVNKIFIELLLKKYVKIKK